MIQSTLLAKAAYRLAGYLMVIKTPRKTFSLEFTGEGDDIDFVSTPAGRMWLPCQTGVKMLQLSQKLDHNHWDHWALEHNDCGWLYCNECHGRICGPLLDGDE